MKTNEERLEGLFQHLNSLDHIKVEDIPQIDLYMDQVTTFMEKHLRELKRYPEDKVLTKTMINNYAKNNLLPSPVRKKYTQDHILLLVFIYYFKNLLISQSTTSVKLRFLCPRYIQRYLPWNTARWIN